MRVQYGALPYRFKPDTALEILLVTTRQSKRWIIPKGRPIKGLKPAKTAAREADQHHRPGRGFENGVISPLGHFVNAATYRLFMARFAYENDVFIRIQRALRQ
jgi:hypothetical protein